MTPSHAYTDRTLAPTVALLTALALAATSIAGPLNPPAGAITSTAKSLVEIEPRTAINAENTPGDADSTCRITQPGSYYLTANLLGQTGKSGIEIASSNVTIDLNGFTLDGQGDATTLSGIVFTALGTHNNITIRNGAVVGWGGSGIFMTQTGLFGKRIERVITRGNLSSGIFVGSDSAVNDCMAISNGGSGMSVSTNAVVTNCVAVGNTNVGIAAGSGVTITNCTSRDNGTHGFETSGHAVFAHCAATSNDARGFSIGSKSIVSSCSSSDNVQDGITVGTGCTVIGSSVCSNGIYGINAGAGCLIADNAVQSSGASGIAFSDGSTIRGNTSRANGTAIGGSSALWSNGSNSRIEGNTCTGAAYGIRLITGSRNVIVGNQCSGATIENWRFAANNIYGPIIDRSVVATAVVGGNTAASTLATTDPNANITN